MDKITRSIAIRLAVVLFFVMGLVGWMSGHEPAVCAWRAFVGAFIIYLTLRVAGNLVVRMLLEAMARQQVRRDQKQVG